MIKLDFLRLLDAHHDNSNSSAHIQISFTIYALIKFLGSSILAFRLQTDFSLPLDKPNFTASI